MAVRHVLKIDNEDEKKTLKTKSVRVKQFDKGLQALVQDMIDTMREHNGVGLAAVQIGVLRRVVVIETPAVEEEREDGTVEVVEPSKLYVFVNPEITEMSDERYTAQEGCLSLPGWYGDVPRRTWISLKYQDVQGKEHRLKRIDGTAYKLGHMIQHEVDHTEGVLFTERIEDLSTLRNLHEEQQQKRRRPGIFRRRPRLAEPAE
jgi:peptide deformylase